MSNSSINPSLVRHLLREHLRSDADFMAFCQDNFPDVGARFTSGMERVQKENILLEQVSDRAEIIRLLPGFALRAPVKSRLGWPYVLAVLAAFSAAGAGFLAWQSMPYKRTLITPASELLQSTLSGTTSPTANERLQSTAFEVPLGTAACDKREGVGSGTQVINTGTITAAGSVTIGVDLAAAPSPTAGHPRASREPHPGIKPKTARTCDSKLALP